MFGVFVVGGERRQAFIVNDHKVHFVLPRNVLVCKIDSVGAACGNTRERLAEFVCFRWRDTKIDEGAVGSRPNEPRAPISRVSNEAFQFVDELISSSNSA